MGSQYFAPAPQCPHPRSHPRHPHRRSFFSAKPTFFPRSGFFFGRRGCEWGAKQPTVGESGDKSENEFSGFIPLVAPRKGFSPHIPASRLFVLFHPSQAISPTKKKEHSLLVLPSVHTIINFATKFFEMFTKKQSEQPHKVFQMFQVFRVFQV